MGGMEYFSRPAAWFVLIAILFELALGALALGVGGIFAYWPLVGLTRSDVSPASLLTAIGFGMIATAPMTAGLAVVVESRWRVLDDMKSLAERLLAPMLRGVTPLELLSVALAAGFGEELLFRGLIQEGLAHWWSGFPAGWLAAWLLTSALFGVCHWLSGTYAFLAMLAGLYLGLLLMVFDNLLVPMTAHAMYDLAALLYLANRARDEREDW
jgi:CAAX protease family protein